MGGKCLILYEFLFCFDFFNHMHEWFFYIKKNDLDFEIGQFCFLIYNFLTKNKASKNLTVINE